MCERIKNILEKRNGQKIAARAVQRAVLGAGYGGLGGTLTGHLSTYYL